MALIVAEFFGLVGLEMVPPSNFSEFIPYFLVFLVGVVLVGGVFRLLGALVSLFAGFRRWR